MFTTLYQIHCRLQLENAPSTVEPDEIPNCTCYNNESCDSGAWSYWSNCDGKCQQIRIRNKDETDEETESRDCQNLCFLDVEDDVDEELNTCSIRNSRSKRDALNAINSRKRTPRKRTPRKRTTGKRTSRKKTSGKRTSRLMNGSSAYPGSLPYIVRLTFQSFDQFHSDTQAGFFSTESFFGLRLDCPFDT